MLGRPISDQDTAPSQHVGSRRSELRSNLLWHGEPDWKALRHFTCPAMDLTMRLLVSLATHSIVVQGQRRSRRTIFRTRRRSGTNRRLPAFRGRNAISARDRVECLGQARRVYQYSSQHPGRHQPATLCIRYQDLYRAGGYSVQSGTAWGAYTGLYGLGGAYTRLDRPRMA